MRIRTHTFVTLDGHVSTPDGQPIQLLLPGFPGATAYGLPEFLASCEASSWAAPPSSRRSRRQSGRGPSRYSS